MSHEYTRAAKARALALSSREQYVAALHEERRGYQQRGLTARAEAVTQLLEEAESELVEYRELDSTIVSAVSAAATATQGEAGKLSAAEALAAAEAPASDVKPAPRKPAAKASK